MSVPVGYQCPDCAGVAPVQPRPAARPQASGGTPVITYTLIGINLVLFGLQYLVGVSDSSVDYGMWPVAIAVNGEWWRLLTSAFLHGGLLHIAFNMYVLFLIGTALERVLGHTRYVLLYLVAALGGSVASYLFSDLRTVSVGASGAIFGLMGALLVAGRRLRYDIKQVAILLAINIGIGFLVPDVDWRAHLGGLLVGAAVAAVYVLAPRRGRVLWQSTGVAAIVVVLLALTSMRTAQILDLIAPLGITSL